MTLPRDGEHARVMLEVEEALGPGIDFRPGDLGEPVIATRARAGVGWLGFDRAVVLDSDDGQGRLIPVLVALPVSTYAGCRIEAELVGGLAATEGNVVLLARLPGVEVPALPIARAAARVVAGGLLDAAEARRFATKARATYRARRAQERIVGGRAWLPSGVELSAERFTTPHSLAEYSLSRVPPRFVRGLEGLLDSDERILYWVERLPQLDSLAQRVMRRTDRRAALLLITDRQALWLIDHMQPDHQLTDWGVDVDIVPIETVSSVQQETQAQRSVLVLSTPKGASSYDFPSELKQELGVAGRVIGRFVAGPESRLPRRIYDIEPVPFNFDHAERFKQGAEADELLAHVPGNLGFVFSPARPGQRRAAGLGITNDAVELLGPVRHSIRVADVHAIHIVLSPLVGIIRLVGQGPEVEIVFPAPFASHAASVVRVLRKLMANCLQ